MSKSKIILFSFLLIIATLFVVAETEVINLKDWTKVEIVSPTESNGAIPVNIQDQTTPPFDLFFARGVGIPTNISSQAQIDNRSVSVLNVATLSVGDYIIIAEEDRYYTGELLVITGNIITLDTPIDYNFTTQAVVIPTSRDLNVDGSITPQIFTVQVGAVSNLQLDVTRLMLHMETDGLVDLNKFGDLAALTNGVVIRRVDGTTRNIFNIKTNGEMRNLCFDWAVDVASNPSQGQNGVGFRYTFAGQDKHGVAVRIGAGDELQLIVQDDLTGLDKFRVIAEGHEVFN